MIENSPKKIDVPVPDPNSFIYGSPTDEEIRLQALNHSKDKLLSIVGHDLRSAIGSVIGIVSMLEKSLKKGNVEEAKRLSGMSEEVQSLLLKIDERKQVAGTSGETGSGFGLLLCEDFIQRHGGHLTWESTLGKGTTFSFTIPELIG